jgi:undecaprenyl-diphosphatase
MRRIWQRSREWADAEPWLLACMLAVAALLLVFGLIANQVMAGSTLGFDHAVILAFRTAGNPSDPIGPPWMQEAARDITALGSFSALGMLVLVVVVYLFFARKHAAAWLVLTAVLGGVALNTLLKVGFGRPRPDFIAPAARVFTASFPSGHAAISAVTYLTLAALLARTTDSRRLRIYFVATGMTLTLMVGVSRIYLGVHYPTDVLAGWCIGSAWALGCWAIMTRLQRTGQVEPPQHQSDDAA